MNGMSSSPDFAFHHSAMKMTKAGNATTATASRGNGRKEAEGGKDPGRRRDDARGKPDNQCSPFLHGNHIDMTISITRRKRRSELTWTIRMNGAPCALVISAFAM